MAELLDSEEEEEAKGRGMTRSWLKKRKKLGYFTNIVRELQLEDTKGFKELTTMDLKLIAPDFKPQEIIGGNKVISAAERLTCGTNVFGYRRNFSVIEFSIPHF